MALHQQIEQDYLSAYKAGDKFTVSVLRMLKSVIQNKKIETGAGKDDILSDDELVVVIKSEIKKRKDSAVSYGEAGRADLVKQEEDEVVVLAKYMPAQIGDDQVREIVKEVLAIMNAATPADFGKAMGAVMAKVKGQADGQVISKIVKEELGR